VWFSGGLCWLVCIALQAADGSAPAPVPTPVSEQTQWLAGSLPASYPATLLSLASLPSVNQIIITFDSIIGLRLVLYRSSAPAAARIWKTFVK